MRIHFNCFLLFLVHSSTGQDFIRPENINGKGEDDQSGRKRDSNLSKPCSVDTDCENEILVCKNDRTCGMKGRGKGSFGDECEHQSDCGKSLLCNGGRCGNFGFKDDSCKEHSHCRSTFYCSGIEKKGDGTCKPRRTVGQRCKNHYHCIESICMEERFVIVGQDKIVKTSNFYCAVMGAKLNGECDPTRNHCLGGFICSKVGAGKKQQQKSPPRRRPVQDEEVDNPNQAGGEHYGEGGYGSPQNRFQPRKSRKRGRRSIHDSEAYDEYEDIKDSPEDFERFREVLIGDYGYEDENEGSSSENDSPKGRASFGSSQRRTKSSGKISTFVCKPLPSLGSREPCSSSLACGCGEFCDKGQKLCRAATCASGAECARYPGFTHRFTCQNNMCMPPQEIYSKVFEKKFDNESIVKGNSTAVGPQIQGRIGKRGKRGKGKSPKRG